MLRTAVPRPEPIYLRVGCILNRVFRQEKFIRFLWFLVSLIKNSRTLRNCYLFSGRFKTLWDIGMRLKPHFLQKMSITLKPTKTDFSLTSANRPQSSLVLYLQFWKSIVTVELAAQMPSWSNLILKCNANTFVKVDAQIEESCQRAISYLQSWYSSPKV